MNYRTLLFFLLFFAECYCDFFSTSNPTPFYCTSGYQYGSGAQWTAPAYGFCTGTSVNTSATVNLNNGASNVLGLQISVPYLSQADFVVQGVQVNLTYSLSGSATLTLAQLAFNNVTAGNNQASSGILLSGNTLTLGAANSLWGLSSSAFNYPTMEIQLALSATGSATFTLQSLAVQLMGTVQVILVDVEPNYQNSTQALDTALVTIVGVNFVNLVNDPSKIICMFGSSPSLFPGVLVNSHQITCRPPQGTGFVPVNVDLGLGPTKFTSVLYLYKNGPGSCPGNGNCNGNGFCDQANSTCVCNFGYTSADCSMADCSALPCQNGGVCIFNTTINAPMCQCQSNDFGATCGLSSPVNDCSDRLNCSSHGSCVSGACSCSSGWRGIACNVPDCSSLQECNPPFGFCSGPNNCTCFTSQGNINTCAQMCTSCPTGATCVGNGACQCPSGSAAPYCNTTVLESCPTLGNCTENGTCYTDPLSTSPFCSCNAFWLGSNCSVGDCSVKKNCSYPNGVCVGANLCQCVSGFIGTDCSQAVTPIQPAVSHKNATLGIALGVAFGMLFVLGILFAVLIFLYCTRANRRRRKLTPPNFTEIAFSVDSKSKYNLDSKISTLEKLLLESDHILLNSIVNITQSTEADNLSKCLVYLFCANGRGLELMKVYIDAELSTSESANTLFRANSMSTKMFKVYSKILGLQYLWKMLALHIDGIVQSSLEQEEERKEAEKNAQKTGSVARSSSINNFELEIDPSRMEEGSDQIANKFQLLLICQKIFTSITRSLDFMPPTLRAVIAHVKVGTEKAFPGAEYKALGGFLFLRFICPALVAPHTYGLTAQPPSASVQRQLVLLSKILQNLANEAEFGAKEEYMAKLNAFVHDNKPELVKFYAKITSESDPSDTPVPMPNAAKENALGFLHEHIIANIDKINADLDTHPEGTRVKTELKNTLDTLSPPEKK